MDEERGKGMGVQRDEAKRRKDARREQGGAGRGKTEEQSREEETER